jgi:multidrug efflux pump subunit AcrB
MNVGKFSVSNSVLINVLMIAVLLMGVLSFLRLPRELMSDVAFSWVFIAVPYPGVSAEEIEKNVTIEIEEELSDIDHVKQISSTTSEGVCFVMVEAEDDHSDREFDQLYQEVRTEFDKVSLPDGTLDPWIDDFTTSDFMAIITIILTAENDVDIDTINKTATLLREKLLDVPNVSQVEIVGGQEREIWIEVDRSRLDAFGISLDEVVAALGSQNMNVPGGNLDVGTRTYLLQTLGEVQKPSAFEKIIVRRVPGQGSVKVSDVATINNGYAESEYDARFNGNKSIALLVSKRIEGSSLQVVDDVRKTAAQFEDILPPGLSLVYFNDTTVMIRDILGKLGSNSVMGFLLLIIVLFIFIGFRNSLITALGIPMTFAITFIFMEWYGESLNGNSLFGLVLVLGMIVDHAIVIVENSYRLRQSGLSARESAIQGTNEVLKPVIAATLTTIAAFLPLMLLPGIMGKFMRIIPIVVSLALVASTLEALVFLPVHFAEWGGRVKEKGTGFIGRWQDRFKRLLCRFYRRRYLTLLVTVTIIGITVALVFFVKQDLFAGEDFTEFFIDIYLPIGTPRSMTDRVTQRYEERLIPLIGNGDIVSISTTVGFLQTDTEWITQSNVAQIVVDVTEQNEGRERPIIVIMRELKRFCNDIPGAERVNFRMVNTGPPVEKPVTFRLLGDNYDDMASIAEDFKNLLGEYPELYNIEDNYDRGNPELRIVVNESRAAELGLNAASIGLYVRHCFDGITATTFYEEDEEIDVIVKFSKEDRESIYDVQQMKFPTPDGRMVPFSAVCSLERGRGITKIKRVDESREITVSADADDKRNIRAIMARVERTFAEKYREIYPEISLEMGGEFAEFNLLLMDILRLFWVGLFLIYVVLGAQFKSFLQPFIMIFTIPFAFVGCILFLIVSGTPISVVVLYAGVALAGICVNDSIVLISFINNLREKGTEVEEAIIQGGAVRLRPIILTSVTTIGGLLPMAVGLGGYSKTWGPMAATVIFGLFFSTVGTLIVIPCVYGIFNDIMRKFGKRVTMERG